ncbi:hypothetical protein IC582_013910 [Cucumis melo]
MSATGSATVIIAMMERDGILKIANVGDYGMLIIAHVGDCGLKIIRKSQIIFSTSPQEHFFDCPYQLSSERVGQTFLDATVVMKNGGTTVRRGRHALSRKAEQTDPTNDIRIELGEARLTLMLH